MDITVTHDGENCYLVQCPHEMNWDVREALLTALLKVSGGMPVQRVVLDLSGVSFISSAGLGGIFTLRKHVLAAGGQLVLACPGAAVMRLFKTIYLEKLIPVAETLDQARQSGQAA